MRIGLFGGSFNPPHVCHTLVTIWALDTQPVDAVWWIPTFDHAFDKDLVDYDHRHRMSELALGHVDGQVRVSDIERELGGESRTIDTVRALEERRPEDDFSLIVGSDILEETDDWKQWDELVDRVELIVVARAGYEGPSSEDVSRFWLPDVSSTDVREALRGGDRELARDWVATPILEYIDEADLYVGQGEATGDGV